MFRPLQSTQTTEVHVDVCFSIFVFVYKSHAPSWMEYGQI